MKNSVDHGGNGVVPAMLLILLAAAGGAAGLYLSGAWTAAPVSVSTKQPAAEDSAKVQKQLDGLTQFPLSSFDVKDTAEAPDLAVGASDCVYATWGSKTSETERSVFVVRSIDRGRTFESPMVLSMGGIYRTKSREPARGGYERRAMPHIASVGERVEVTWSEVLPDCSAMRLLLATSLDGGATFSRPSPLDTGARSNPTFSGLAGGADGTLASTWLDDSAGAQQVCAAVRHSGAEAFEPARVVHSGQDTKGVCPCCPTVACVAPDGTVFVAFRNVEDGYRDMFVSRLRPGHHSFDRPVPIVPHTWKFDGCPHDGASMAVAGGRLHIVWMDARTGAQRCYYAWADQTDLRFKSSELHSISGGSQGNAKLYADASGGLHVVWEESTSDEPAGGGMHRHGDDDARDAKRAAPPQKVSSGGRAVMYAQSRAGDGHFESPRALAERPGAFQTRPALIGTVDGTIHVAWNELDENGKRIVIASFTDRKPNHDRE